MLKARGFTLVEAMVALALSALIAGLLVALLRHAMSVVAFERQRLEANRTLRAGALFASYEWSGLTPGNGDFALVEPTRLLYRGPRGLGFACGVQSGAITVRDDLRYGVRSWVAGRDSLLVFAAGDSLAGTGTRWVALPLMGVAPAPCGDGRAGLRLATATSPTMLSLGEILVGSPVRVFESMESRLYRSGSDWWLGLRSSTGGGAIQPALGPFPSNGVEFLYRDLTGAPTADPALAASLTAKFRVTFTAPVSGWGRRPSQWTDSLVVSLVTHNALGTGAP